MVMDLDLFGRRIRKLLKNKEPDSPKITIEEYRKRQKASLRKVQETLFERQQKDIAAERRAFRRRTLETLIKQHEANLQKTERHIQHKVSELNEAGQVAHQALKQLGHSSDHSFSPVIRVKKEKNINQLLTNADEAYGPYAGQEDIGQPYSSEKDPFIQSLNALKL